VELPEQRPCPKVQMMITYCMVCRNPIPLARQNRSARTCNKECATAYRKGYNESLAERKCKSCGRRKRQPKAKGAVLQEVQNGKANLPDLGN
jgi:hypothetical protein